MDLGFVILHTASSVLGSNPLYSTTASCSADSFLVVDDLGSFLMDLDWNASFRQEGTTAQQLRHLAALGASYGIHLMVASQRYQASDIPLMLRNLFGCRFVNRVNAFDADLLNVPEAVGLDLNKHAVTCAGVSFEGLSSPNVIFEKPYHGFDLESEGGERAMLDFMKKHLKTN